MKPIILITVYRRYRELLKCLENIDNLKSELSEPPEIVVVWASPIIGQLWFFQQLIREGKINHLLLRDKIELDGAGPTTRPESLNLRLGLNFIKKNYDENVYIIGQAGDVLPNEGIYKMIDQLISNGEKAVLFFWQNQIARENAWHTNFFAITTNESYWPPISDNSDADTLEVQWGKQLGEKRLAFYKTHNSRNLKFQEVNLPYMPLALIPQKDNGCINLSIVGYKSLFRRIRDFFRRILWLK